MLDGSSGQAPSVELEGIDDTVVLTSAAVLPVASIIPQSAAGTCLRERHSSLEAAGSAVARIGVSSESVTFRQAPGVAIFGCSNTAGEREENRRWCGISSGRLNSGRLDDPRLDIICKTTEGTSVGFVWVQPNDDVRYIAVEQPGYTEVYEAAAGLPIRIATVSGVDVEASSATFTISEHDAEGRRIREYELVAFVAG